MQHTDTIKIVTPDWVVDCINKKARQEEKIYHPKLILDKPEEELAKESDAANAEKLSQDSQAVPETSQGSSSGAAASTSKSSKTQYKITAPWAEDVEKVSDILLPGGSGGGSGHHHHRHHHKHSSPDGKTKEKKKRRPRGKNKKKKSERGDASSAPTLPLSQESSLMGNFPETEFPRTLRNITNNGEHAALLGVGVVGGVQQLPGGERRQLSQVLSAIAGMASQNRGREQTISAPLLPEVKYYGHDPTYNSKWIMSMKNFFVQNQIDYYSRFDSVVLCVMVYTFAQNDLFCSELLPVEGAVLVNRGSYT